MASTPELVVLDADNFLDSERSAERFGQLARNLVAYLEDVEVAATGAGHWGGLDDERMLGDAKVEEARALWNSFGSSLVAARHTAEGLISAPPSTRTAQTAGNEAIRLAEHLTMYDDAPHIREPAIALRTAIRTRHLEAARQLVRALSDEYRTRVLGAFVYAFAALAEPPPTTKPTRTSVITPDEAARTMAAFEGPFAGLQRLAYDGTLNEADEHFFRSTIVSIEQWRQRDDANPQIFELLIADLVKRLLTRLVDVDEMEKALCRFGADDATARDVAERVVAAVNIMTELGGSDGAHDAELLQAITDQTDRIEDALRSLVPPPRKGLARKTGEAAVIGGGAAAGKTIAVAGLHAVLHAFEDHWSGIRIGLMMAWRTVRELFVN